MLQKGPGSLYKTQTKEERERLKGKGDKIKFVDLRFDRAHIVGFEKGRRMQASHKLHVLGMNDDLYRVCGLGSESWKGCE